MKKATGLSWLQFTYSFPLAGNTQYFDSERIETINVNHICIVYTVYCTVYYNDLFW